MTDASYSADLPDVDDALPDGVDLNRTPLAADPPGSSAYDPDAMKVDLYGNPTGRNPYFPDPDASNLEGGQVLYHMALGAKPEDFHPALQPLARSYSIAFQPPPPQVPGLLGSLDDIKAATTSAPEEKDGSDEDASNEQIDEPDVTPAAISERTALPSAYPKTLDPTVDRHVTEYNQAHGLKPGDPEYLDPDMVKAMIRQEAGHDYNALISDPMQVNASPLDWDQRKASFGLQKGVAPGADLSVKAGIQWLHGKAYPHDAQGNETRFIGWPQAVQKYNGHLPDYSDQVWDHLGEIKAGF